MYLSQTIQYSLHFHTTIDWFRDMCIRGWGNHTFMGETSKCQYTVLVTAIATAKMVNLLS